jgi:hypothetical protein
MNQGRFSTLRKMPAHGANHGVDAVLCPEDADLIGVTLVKGVVFGDDAGDFHNQMTPQWKDVF